MWWFILGVLITMACVVVYEKISDLPFSWLLEDVLYDVCQFLFSPFVFFWYMTRLLYKGITPEQYKDFITAPGTYSIRLMGRIYYVNDPAGRKFLTRHALLRVRR